MSGLIQEPMPKPNSNTILLINQTLLLWFLLSAVHLPTFILTFRIDLKMLLAFCLELKLKSKIMYFKSCWKFHQVSKNNHKMSKVKYKNTSKRKINPNNLVLILLSNLSSKIHKYSNSTAHRIFPQLKVIFESQWIWW